MRSAYRCFKMRDSSTMSSDAAAGAAAECSAARPFQPDKAAASWEAAYPDLEEAFKVYGKKSLTVVPKPGEISTAMAPALQSQADLASSAGRKGKDVPFGHLCAPCLDSVQGMTQRQASVARQCTWSANVASAGCASITCQQCTLPPQS